MSEKDRLSDEEVIAQVSYAITVQLEERSVLTISRTFVLAGTDTTSNATSRLLHLLAMNPIAQEKLRQEIVEAQAGTEIAYDTLMNLPYLDAVCRETLRLYVLHFQTYSVAIP